MCVRREGAGYRLTDSGHTTVTWQSFISVVDLFSAEAKAEALGWVKKDDKAMFYLVFISVVGPA